MNLPRSFVVGVIGLLVGFAAGTGEAWQELSGNALKAAGGGPDLICEFDFGSGGGTGWRIAGGEFCREEPG